MQDYGEPNHGGKIELAKNAIKSGELTLEQIAKVLDLSLPIVEELARTQAVGA